MGRAGPREVLKAALGASLIATAHSGTASEYGCTVLLCLSHPDGPEAVAQCVDPIRRLRQDLARGRPFPSCEEASADGSTRAQLSNSRYPPCPQGTAELANGEYAMLAGSISPDVLPVRGIGDGSLAAYSGNEVRTLPAKTCVAHRTGVTQVVIGPADSATPIEIGLYRDLVQIEATEGVAIDVIIRNQLYRQVRWQ